MAKKKIEKIVDKWENTDKWLKKVVGFIGTITAVVGIVVGCINGVTASFDTYINKHTEAIATQVDSLRTDVEAMARKEELATTRLELTTLIAHSPENKVEIEKIAKHYFVDLGGDWYMSQIYSQWAEEHEGNTTFVTQ